MLSLAKQRGIKPDAVVMDTWYSSLDKKKSIRSHGWVWVTALRKNRIVNRKATLETLDIPEEGLLVPLRGYGWIRVFKFVAKIYQQNWNIIKTSTQQQIRALMSHRIVLKI